MVRREAICVCVYVLVTQSYLTLCDSMDCSLPGSSVHEILQAGILLEWIAMLASRGYSQPRDRIHIPCICCAGRQILYPLKHLLLLFSRSVVSSSFRPHALQHTRFPVLHYLSELVETHVH